MNCAPAELVAGVAHVTCIVTESSLLVPLVSLVTATIAAWVALQSIENARDLARRKATLDLIEKNESTEHYRRLIDSFTQVRDENLFRHLVDKSVTELAPERAALIDYLNHYELVAISIRNGILDADMYRLWMQSAFVADWNSVAPWVQAIRMRDRTDADPDAYNHRAYEHFETMARRWSPAAIALDARQPPPLRQTVFTDSSALDRIKAGRPAKPG